MLCNMYALTIWRDNDSISERFLLCFGFKNINHVFCWMLFILAALAWFFVLTENIMWKWSNVAIASFGSLDHDASKQQIKWREILSFVFLGEKLWVSSNSLTLIWLVVYHYHLSKKKLYTIEIEWLLLSIKEQKSIKIYK